MPRFPGGVYLVLNLVSASLITSVNTIVYRQSISTFCVLMISSWVVGPGAHCPQGEHSLTGVSATGRALTAIQDRDKLRTKTGKEIWQESNIELRKDKKLYKECRQVKRKN